MENILENYKLTIMGELSIEEKAKRYDEAIKLAKDSFNYPDYPGFIRADVVFPELEESEDERIRKEIISALKYANHKGVYDKHLAWLEKQGDKDTHVTLPTFTFDDILALQCCMETANKVQEDKELYEKLKDLHSRVYDAYHFEKQCEKKPAEISNICEFSIKTWKL